MLLIGSLLQVRSILKQQTIDYGYDTDGILSARMGLMDGDYPSADARRLFYDRLLRALRANPEFDAVGFTSRFRMVFSGNGPIEIDGKTYKDKKDRPHANFEQVTGTFFDVTSQKLLEGRTFNDDDLDAKLPVSDRQRGVRAQALRQREPDRPPLPDDEQRRHAAGAVAHDRRRRLDRADARAVQQPGRRRQRLLRAVLLDGVRPGAAGAVRQPVRDGRREAARRASGRTRWSTRCGAR